MNEIKYFFMNKLHVTKVSWTCYIYEWESERVRSEKDVRGGKDYGQFHTEKQWRVSRAPHLHDLSRVNRVLTFNTLNIEDSLQKTQNAK